MSAFVRLGEGRPRVAETRLTRDLEHLLPVLRCPASGAALDWDARGMLHAAEHRYPVVDGVPVLIAKELSLFDPDAIIARAHRASESTGRRLLRWLIHHPPTLSRSVGSDENYRTLRQLLQQVPRAACTQAASARRWQAAHRGRRRGAVLRRHCETIETDVYIGPEPPVVCDAHNLPFADGTFDAVVCQAVLEHVLDPWRVAQEVRRVLTPDGYVYSEVPFMQQVHEGAFDFTRFTHVGHRRLWHEFDESVRARRGAQEWR